MAEFPEHPFWDFSLKVYMSEGVGAACLDLQDAHELDVNILLFCQWLGASGRGVLTPEQMKTVTAAVGVWHEDVVRALRAVRTLMKGGMDPAPPALAESLRQRIQKTEIDCEHTEQLMLAGAVETEADEARAEADGLKDAVANISQYFQMFGGLLSAADRENLGIMLRVAFPGQTAADIKAAYDSM